MSGVTATQSARFFKAAFSLETQSANGSRHMARWDKHSTREAAMTAMQGVWAALANSVEGDVIVP